MGAYRNAREPIRLIPPITSTSTTTSATTTLLVPPPFLDGDLLTARVGSATVLVPTTVLKEVVQVPEWDQKIFLLDIREQEEREVGVVDASTTWMRFGDLLHGGEASLPKDRDILVICWTSLRGEETVAWMRSHGLPRAFAIRGGLQGVLERDGHGWIPDGLPWKGDTRWSTAFDAFEYPKVVSLTRAKRVYDVGALVIDVREEDLYERGHILGAWSLPLQTAPTALADQVMGQIRSTSTHVLIYADGYVNTFYAKVLGLRLLRLGYTHTTLLLDVTHAWKGHGYPFTSPLSPVDQEETLISIKL